MKVFLVVLAILTIAWSLYDLFGVICIKNKYKDDSIRMVFSAPNWCYVCVGMGIALSILCICMACIHSKVSLLFLGAACILGALREFSHCYYFETDQYIIMNQRKIESNVVKEHGVIKPMAVLSYIKLFEVNTDEYREYVYANKSFSENREYEN